MEHYKNLSFDNIIEEVDGIIYVEDWKPISKFPYYLISSFGRVKSLSKIKIRNNTGNFITKEKILKQHRSRKTGYLGLSICNNRTYQKNVHVLVANEFVPNPQNKPDVNHKKGIKTDNRACMLEWNTKSENTLHAISMGLIKVKSGTDNHMFGRFGNKHHNSIPVIQSDIVGTKINRFNGVLEASRYTGLFAQNISNVCKGKRELCGGFKWEYENAI